MSAKARLERLERFAVAIPTLVVPAVLALPMLAGKALIYRDVLGLTVPLQTLRHHALAAGRLPEWNPFSYGGAPFLADPGSGLFYPGNILFDIFSPLVAASLFVVLHVALAGLAAYVLLRIERLPRLSCAAGATVYASSGYLLSMQGMHYALSAPALLPLVVAAFLWLWRAPTRRKFALAAAAWALVFFNGEWEESVFAALAIAAIGLTDEERSWRRVGLVAGAAAMGTALAAVQVVPTLLYSHETVRSLAEPLATAANWSLHPARWLEFAVPQLFGAPIPDNHFFGIDFLEGRRTSPWAASLYLPGAFAFVALLGGWWRARRTRAWMAVGLFALLVAAGTHLPFFQLWWRFVPFVDRFRYPEKYAALTTLAFVVVGAHALASILRDATWPKRIVVPALVLLAAAVVVPHLSPGWFAERLRRADAGTTATVAMHEAAFALARAGLVALAMAVGLAFFARGRRVAGLAVGALLVVDAVWNVRTVVVWSDASFTKSTPPIVAELESSIAKTSAGRVFRDACPFVEPDDRGTALERSWRFQWRTGKSNVLSLFDVRDAVGYGPTEPLARWRLFRAMSKASPEALLRLFGVAAQIDCDSRGIPHATPLANPMPRVAVVTSRAVSSEALVPALSVLDFNCEAWVADPSLARASDPRARASVREDLPERVTVDATGPGLLVLADSWSAGWSATVDGRPAPLGVADGLWRGVPLGDGAHLVVFRYRTPGLAAGFAVTLAAALFALGLALVRRSRRPRRGA